MRRIGFLRRSGIIGQYIGSDTIDASSNVYNFDSFDVAAGLMVVAFGSNGGTQPGVVSGINIGGGAATLNRVSSSSSQQMAIASRVVSAGSHAVQVNLDNGNNASPALHVWLLTNYQSVTPYDTDLTAQLDDNDLTLTMDLPANGFAIYAAMHLNINSASWGGDAEKRADVFASVGNRHTAADKAVAEAATGNAQTLLYANSAGLRGISAVWH